MFLENTLYNPIPRSAEVEFKDKIVIVGSNAPVLEGFNDLRVASLLCNHFVTISHFHQSRSTRHFAHKYSSKHCSLAFLFKFFIQQFYSY